MIADGVSIDNARRADLRRAVSVQHYIKLGHNPNVNGTNQLIACDGASVNPWLTPAQAAPVYVPAGGNANDTFGGSGANQLVLFDTLDQNGIQRAPEVINLAGASASAASSGNIIRINRAWVTTGTKRGPAAANIPIHTTTSAQWLATIQPTFKQTQRAVYTVPLGHAVYLWNMFFFVADQKSVTINLWLTPNILETSPPYLARIAVANFPGVVGSFHAPTMVPARFGELTDIEFTATGTTAAVSVMFSMELIKLPEAP